VVAAAPQQVDDLAVHSLLLARLDDPTPLPDVPDTHREGIRAYYQAGSDALIWVGTSRPAALIARLQSADTDGLDPTRYPIAALAARQASAGRDTSDRLAETELVFSGAFLMFASDLMFGRFAATMNEPSSTPPRSINPIESLTALGASSSIETFLAELAPANPQYVRLRSALAQYRAIDAHGGWPSVPAGDALEPGARNHRVPLVRARLQAEGDLAAGANGGDAYDPAMVKAVKRFQQRHGLAADGVVSRATVAEMNVNAAARVRQILVNMERLRWLQPDLGKRHVRVNVANYQLFLVEDGVTQDEIAVVVGERDNRTPVLSSEIQYVEFNPYWNVPNSIAVKEELPRLKRNPAKMEALGFEVLSDGQRLPVSRVDWSAISKDNFRYTLRQKPGPKNALGKVKFIFPNAYGVYLHDTSSRRLFGRSARALSHGCVRVARPVDLAVDVLRDTPGWGQERIQAAIAASTNKRVYLAEPFAIHLTYETAWADADGTAHFIGDIYDRDKPLAEALTGTRS
jgi:murein L,D-transpeptidase YcbB/YkuD